jgi:hypothetical protein
MSKSSSLARTFGLGATIVSIAILGLVWLGTRPSSGTAANPALPAAKQALLDAEAQARASASRAPKSSSLALSNRKQAALMNGNTAVTPSTWPTGISLTTQGPFSSSVFAVTSDWVGSVSGSWFEIYAGGVVSPDGSGSVGGAVRIYALPSSPNAQIDWSSPRIVPAPTGVGLLTLTSANASTLTMTGADGTVVSFDLSSMTFG